jgi:tripartite-type tricarboxylate transporter receptor subunit TctC
LERKPEGRFREAMQQYDARRRALLALAALTLPLVAARQAAAAYPERPIRLILPFGAGGTTDIYARQMADRLQRRIGQPVVVEPRPGGGTAIGTEFAVRAPADGYTLLMQGASLAVLPSTHPNLTFDVVRDLQPIRNGIAFPLVLVAHPGAGIGSVPDLLGRAAAHPGRLDIAVSGVGNSPHLAGELFKTMARLDVTFVPYRGSGEALNAVLKGEVPLHIAAPNPTMSHVAERRLVALATMSAARSPVTPDVQALGEFVRGYDASFWMGFFAPRGTPRSVVETLNKEIGVIMHDEEFVRLLLAQGIAALPDNTPEQFAQEIAEALVKWGGVVRAANIPAQ